MQGSLLKGVSKPREGEMNNIEKMNLTIDLAEEALNRGEMPISALIFSGDQVIAKAYTSEKSDRRLLVHAELKALLQADLYRYSVVDRKKLQLFTTLEPCLMCYGAAMSFFLGEICYSLKAPEDGALSLINMENFKSDYLHSQKLSISGGYCIQKSKSLFLRYMDIQKEGPLYGFAYQVVKHN
jgi:tRNA(adenine34) deaminase